MVGLIRHWTLPAATSSHHRGEGGRRAIILRSTSAICSLHDRGGDRTHDLRIKSPLLYQLSYRVSGETCAKPPVTVPRSKIGAPRKS